MSNNVKVQKIQDFLRSKNINNINFLNEVYDDIDPFSDNITKEEIEIVKERSKNLWYFTLNLARIETVGSDEPINYELNIQNMTVLYLLEHNLSIYNNACRQSYSTTTRVCYYLWRMINDDNYKFRIFSTSMENSRYVVEKIKQMNELLPDYLRTKTISNRIEILSIINMSTHDIKNIFKTNDCDVMIQDLEHITNVLWLLKGIKASSLNIRVDMFSTVGKTGSPGKYAGDKVVMNSYRWFDELLDVNNLEDIFKDKLIYVKYDFDQIFDNPIYKHHLLTKLYNGDRSAINREIDLIR